MMAMEIHPGSIFLSPMMRTAIIASKAVNMQRAEGQD